MEDSVLERQRKLQKVKPGSSAKKDEDQDFTIKNIIHGNSSVRRNPKRKVEVKNYEEIDEPQDDRYVYCDFCEKVFVDNCTKCGQLSILRDNQVEMGIENRAKLTVPKTTLVILPSPIHGFGVFARLPLKKGVKMGPYEGKITRFESTTGYSWKLRDGRLVDAADERFSNWMRYINCARHVGEQNVVAFQYKGNLYYRTCKDIKIGEELLVYYGQSFANILGIDIKNYFNPKEETMNEHPKICPHCNFGYKDLLKLRDHIFLCKSNPENIKKLPDRMFRCRFCPISIEDQEYYKKHEKFCEKRQKKREKKDEKGNKENEDIVNKERKQLRVTKNNNEIFQCQNCNYSSNNKWHMKTHQVIHGKTFPFSCALCQKGFNTQSQLNVHMLKHINEASNTTILQTTKIHNGKAAKTKILAEIAGSKFDVVKYECTTCKYVTSKSTNIQGHINIHTKKDIFVCYSCDFKSGELKELHVHLRQFHNNENELCCSFCKKEVFCEIHMRRMFKYDINHTCNICGLFFDSRSHLKQHISSVHLQEKNYKCSSCKFETNQKGHLNEHTRAVHLREKQFKCNFCLFSTYHKSNLKQHTNALHLKEKQFKCENCQYTAYRKIYIRSHMKKKHST